MNNREVTVGKGTSLQLEGLHGAITKVYVGGVIGILNHIETEEMISDNYETRCAEAIANGESIDDIEKPQLFGLDKDALALLKQAQGFLKENDIVMDVTSKATTRKVRNQLNINLKKKREELEHQ